MTDQDTPWPVEGHYIPCPVCDQSRMIADDLGIHVLKEHYDAIEAAFKEREER